MNFSKISNELHKPVIRNFERRKVIANSANEIWAIDLADMNDLREANDGYRFILCVIDIFSKYAWCEPIEDKKARTILKMLKKIITGQKVTPFYLWCDEGGEFKNKIIEKYLKENNIIMYSTYGEHKASVVERFIRTIKTWIWKIFTAKHTRNWVDELQPLIKYYNNKVHSTTKMKPINAVKAKHHDEIFNRVFTTKFNEEIQNPKLKVGDNVRISRIKKQFEKGYYDNWSREVFKVYEVLNTSPITYKIMEEDKTKIDGSFYEQELQKTSLPDFYEIEKIIGKEGKKYLVKWLGYDEKYNSLVDAKDIKHLQ